eukprot:scaffold503502_cov23-Prasinocladus_malaysianus.AAC.1
MEVASRYTVVAYILALYASHRVWIQRLDRPYEYGWPTYEAFARLCIPARTNPRTNANLKRRQDCVSVSGGEYEYWYDSGS